MAQALTVQDILYSIEEIAPSSLAETWDNVGLLVGSPSQEVSGLLVALDPTEEVLNEALARGANTIITHHPLIFHPLKAVVIDEPVGRFLKQALAENIAVVGCHTNLDVIAGGVSDALAAALKLQDTRPLADTAADIGFGRIGTLAEPVPGEMLISRVSAALSLPGVNVAGPLPAMVETVAVCGGSGSDLAGAAYRAGAQLYLTGEIKHSTARWAEASGFCLVDGGHFATERPVVRLLAATLAQLSRKKGWNIPVMAADREQNPFTFHPVKETTG
ncbi:MAG: Nif3-like dinuclear metal center hexameric protein [Desulfobacterales bacterium]|nr:Nif3-like dinuclear metal center hexameric protein [Desulfobacterales bacterium]